MNTIESNTRIIQKKNDIIIYTLKHDGVKDYLSFNEELFEILQLDKLKPFRDDGRLRFKVWKDGADVNFYLYDLAYACYAGIIKKDTYLEDLQRYFSNKSAECLSVDHADNNIHNNTMYNLSLMGRQLNMRKGALVAKVKEPIYLNSAYCNGKYRIQMIFAMDKQHTKDFMFKHLFDKGIYINSDTQDKDRIQPMVAGVHFICENAESYVTCLKWLTEQTFEWAKPLKDEKGWIKNNNDCWCLDIHNSIQAQKVLSRMLEEHFQVFTL